MQPPTTVSGANVALKPSYILAGVVAVPLAYYAFAESYRYAVLRRRQAAYNAITLTAAASEAVSQAIKARFASLRCILTGRYQNVTFEWREPGFWEFIIHQLLKPLSGRAWWTGDIPKDPAALAAALPQEPLNVDVLRKNSRKRRSLGTRSPMHSSLASSQSSDDEWEKLDASRTGLAAPSLDSTNQPDMTVTWFGQSTSLVQMEGVTFLTDPVFSDRPLDSFLAPRRLRPPPCSLEELLALDLIDVILISHDHYDHLDVNVVKKVGDKVTWVIPKGLRRFFLKQGVSEPQLIELDWWQEKTLSPAQDLKDSFTVSCTPTQHWSGRTPLDTNKSLWCGFVVKHVGSGKSFFHAGDTGYSSQLYKAIGRMHGPIDLGLIPIGSFEPRWMLSQIHTDPVGSVAIHKDLSIKKSIGVHWGTWIMSDERHCDPPIELAKARFDRDVTEDEFMVLPVGRTVTL